MTFANRYEISENSQTTLAADSAQYEEYDRIVLLSHDILMHRYVNVKIKLSHLKLYRVIPPPRKWLKIVLRLIHAVASTRRLILTPALTKVGGNFTSDSNFSLSRFYNNNIFLSAIMSIIITIITIISRSRESLTVFPFELADAT